MNEAKHTPGPRVVNLDGPFVLGGDSVAVEAMDADGLISREICTLMLDTDAHPDGPEWLEDAANARLIAAAPDLLEVANLGITMREAQNRYFRDRSKDNLIASKQAEAAFDKAARTAINKARGEKETL